MTTELRLRYFVADMMCAAISFERTARRLDAGALALHDRRLQNMALRRKSNG